MNNYSITYWAPGSTNASLLSVAADEFAFTETHVLFITKNDGGPSTVVLAMPLTLQPMVRYTGQAAA